MATRSVYGLGRCTPRHVRIESLIASSNDAGSVAAIAEVKYYIISDGEFVPVAIETSGVWKRQAFDLVNEISHRNTDSRQ